MSSDRTARLGALPGWTWDVQPDAWERAFRLFQAHVAEHGNARVPKAYVVDGTRLGKWIARQRQAWKNGTLPPERIADLESVPGWTWDARIAEWETEYDLLCAYVAANGHARVPARHIVGDVRLGNWVNTQRGAWKRGELSTDRVTRLAALPGWAWDLHDAYWDQAFSLVQAYATEHGDARVPWTCVLDGIRLGAWVGNQRSRMKTGRLSAERVARLEALPGWTWDARTK